jgi:hypothetical protein
MATPGGASGTAPANELLAERGNLTSISPVSSGWSSPLCTHSIGTGSPVGDFDSRPRHAVAVGGQNCVQPTSNSRDGLPDERFKVDTAAVLTGIGAIIASISVRPYYEATGLSGLG